MTLTKVPLKAGTVFLPGLKRVRERRHLSLREVAEISGLTKDSVWRLETLRRAAQQGTRRKLAYALGTTISELRKTDKEAEHGDT